MTTLGWAQIAIYFVVIAVLTKPVGLYLFRVYEGDHQPWPRVLRPVERLLLRASGATERAEQSWSQYAISLLAFSLLGMLGTYAIQRLQGVLPLNRQHFPGVEPTLAFSTAASFTSNTNWQSYSGESTMSYLTQMAGLAWHNFTSAAAGISVALVIARGLTRRAGPDGARTLGNFWVDLIRSLVYVLIPLSVIVA